MGQKQSKRKGWSELDKEDRNSTVGYFVKGWVNDDGKEVLIWRGAEDLDGVHIETHLHDEAPEDAKFVIEVLYDDELQKEKFAEDKSEAVSRALQQLVIEDQ